MLRIKAARTGAACVAWEGSGAARAALFNGIGSLEILVADRLGALRRDDILVTACDHIEGNVEAANSQRRATQGVNRRSMARETGGGMAVRAALMRSTYFCRPSRSAAIIEFA